MAKYDDRRTNAELLRIRKARARFKDPAKALCDANQTIKGDPEDLKYQCWMCKEYKPYDSFSEFQLLKFVGRTCLSCQHKPFHEINAPD
ncbi:hypothetical protein [Vibrio phage J14]|nr:hypothetical protein [Vibrio phage J14]QAY01887.1 hypothetical protein ValSw41_69 [Vibrio phage ValSw4_1]